MKYGTLVRLPLEEDLKLACEEKFGRLKEMGMDACQLVYKPEKYTMEDADIIKACAEKYGIEISAQFCGFFDSYMVWDTYFDYQLQGINSPMFGAGRVEYLLSAIPFMERLGVTDMITHAGFVSNDPFSDSYVRMLASVRVLAGELNKHNMNLLFETGGEAPVTMLKLIDDYGLGNLYVNLDTANLIMYGYGNPVDALYTYGKYVRNTHMKDGMPPTSARKIGKEVPIGTGHVDFEKVVKQLADLQYDRYMIIEQEISGVKEDYMESILEYLKSLVRKYY